MRLNQLLGESEIMSDAINKSVYIYGRDILVSDGIKSEKKFMQHGDTSVYEHSLNVAYLSLFIARFLNIRVNERAIVRGALLHDYFLYDWHVKCEKNRKHGFSHAGRALENARRDFALNAVEEDIIKKHMFPLNIAPPKYRESVIVCIADKIGAAAETLYLSRILFKIK